MSGRVQAFQVRHNAFILLQRTIAIFPSSSHLLFYLPYIHSFTRSRSNLRFVTRPLHPTTWFVNQAFDAYASPVTTQEISLYIPFPSFLNQGWKSAEGICTPLFSSADFGNRKDSKVECRSVAQCGGRGGCVGSRFLSTYLLSFCSPFVFLLYRIGRTIPRTTCLGLNLVLGAMSGAGGGFPTLHGACLFGRTQGQIQQSVGALDPKIRSVLHLFIFRLSFAHCLLTTC